LRRLPTEVFASIPPRPGPRVLKLELKSDGRRLKGFADVEIDGGIIIRSFRVIEEPGDWPQVLAPTISVKPPGRPVYYKTVITLPADLKRAVDFVILTAFKKALSGQKEKDDGTARLG